MMVDETEQALAGAAERRITTDRDARHSSARDDWQTPDLILDPSRALLGAIDLDPASSAIANKRVGASSFYDVIDNGFLMPWGTKDNPSRVFLNPLGGRCDAAGLRVESGCDAITIGGLQPTRGCGLAAPHEHRGPIQAAAKAWWFKLAREYAEGRVRSAIFLGFSVEILQVAQVKPPEGLPLPLDFPLCFPSRRLSYLDAEGKPVRGNTHASVVVYLPDRDGGAARSPLRFKQLFCLVGQCKL